MLYNMFSTGVRELKREFMLYSLLHGIYNLPLCSPNDLPSLLFFSQETSRDDKGMTTPAHTSANYRVEI